ncbi:hypothetical protein ACIRRH_29725 [Kitasatospora sp. NPDC101235]|uniref:hypothetical protein n=1 Tax=Kitasatospora sp. NPDC101235 TaxID=3364101 RepID=UPI00382FE1FA
MRTRTLVVAAAGVGAAALATTGITYTLTAGSASAPPSVQRAAQPVQQAAPAPPAVQPAPPAVQPAAQPVQQAAPAEAVEGGGSEDGEKHEGHDGHEEGGRGHDHEEGGRGHGHEEVGRIYFNERTYSASTEGCVTAASGLGSSSFSIFNDSRKFVAVFRGFSCDNGAPVATVGPHGATNGVVTRTGHWGVFGGDAAVGSFLVMGDLDEW